MAKLPVYTKDNKKGDKSLIGIMTLKPSAAQTKAGKIEHSIDHGDEGVTDITVRFKAGKSKCETVNAEGEAVNYVVDALGTPSADAAAWQSIPGFKTVEEFFGEVEADAEYL